MAETPDQISKYEIQEVIGRGAMGVVYRARDPVIGRIVALKTLNPAVGPESGEGQSAERFTREARAAGGLSHPNIVTVYDFGCLEDTGVSYLAMEYVEGRTLREMAPRGVSLPPDEVLDLAMQVARALDHAHRRDVLHRDIKPANLLIREDGLVKLADFGVARIESSDLTRTGQSVGSPSYIAPEMLQDETVDARADLFSLGVVLYEVLTGRKPFTGESLAALYNQIISVDPPPPSRIRPEVGEEWDEVILRLLQKKPGSRYASAADLLEDLRCLERGQPSMLATTVSAAKGGFELLEEASTAEDPDLERIVEELVTANPPPATPNPVSTHAKALVALMVIAGFALGVMVVAMVLWGAEEVTVNEPVAETRPEPADVMVLLSHNLKTGRIEVSMDGDRILSEAFQGKREGLRTRGVLSRNLEVSAGDHEFVVQVIDDDGKVWRAVTSRRIASQEKAALQAEMTGVVRKSLDLEWR